MNTQVDAYLEKLEDWKEELSLLRQIVLSCSLKENIKWKIPCYTHKGKNVLSLSALKNHCVLGFFKGAYINDPVGFLQKPGPNTQTSRVLRFESTEEIRLKKAVIIDYILQAKNIQETVPIISKIKSLHFPDELTQKLAKEPAFKQAFESLTPGRQRGYVLYFSAAKQSKTRVARIEKYQSKILQGKGFHDCTCGLSKKMPNCDGSHKQLS